MSTIRMSGMISGLDTESIVSAMVSTYVSKKEKYQKAQTKLTWKQEAYKSINTKVYSLYSKISNLRFSSAYSMKKTTVSDSTKATVTASSTATNGTQTLEIKDLATSGYLTGGTLASGTTENTTLGQLGYTGADTTITVSLASGSKDITVGANTKISDLVSSLSAAGVSANYDAGNQRIFVSAKSTGVANDFSLTASNMDGLKALSAAGLCVDSQANRETYAKDASYAKATLASNASGDVVSYYKLDADGNIQYDDDGNAIVSDEVETGGYTYDVAATQEAITATLKGLANAYKENASMAAEKTELQKKINYSTAKDAVDDFTAQFASDSDKAAKANELLTLLEAGSSDYKYVKDGVVYTKQERHNDANGILDGYTYSNDQGDSVDLLMADGSSIMTTTKERIETLKKELGLVEETTKDDGTTETDTSKFDALSANYKTVLGVEKNATMTADDIQAYYLSDTADTSVDPNAVSARAAAQDRITEIDTKTAANKEAIAADSYWDVKNYDAYYDDAGNLNENKLAELAQSVTDKITMGKEMVDGNSSISAYINSDATRMNGTDARIILNGAEFKSSSSTFEINGLTIKATGLTKDDEPLTINTDTDVQGLYDKIKDFLSEYNNVINELCSLYNADSSSGYEPLTDDEKDAMSDTEVEKWETTIKNSLLRRDSTIGGVITAMTNSMMKTYEVNGKTYSLSSFGIKTLGYLNAAENENYAYHIDGDSEDDASSGNTDKLMAALNSDPDSVISFMKQLTSGLYSSLDTKMKSTTMSSAYTIYNDKQMASEYSSYTTLISTWEDRIEDMEDRYYEQFSNMETALAKLQNSSSSVSSLFGTS
jgi:flagellar hook-associated protein 2